MNGQVCVDVNIALKLVLPEEDSAQARSLWEGWIEARMEVVAPSLFLFEAASSLCTQVQRGRITGEESRVLLHTLQAQQVRLLRPAGLHDQALALALRFGHPQAYDAHYLALAESLGCEFWTADARLYRAVLDALPWVRWLGEFQA